MKKKSVKGATEEATSRSNDLKCLVQLPEEVLIEIFTYLPAASLRQMMMTNSVFDQLIGSSSKLMRKFVVKVLMKNRWDFPSLRKLRRKYQNLKLAQFGKCDAFDEPLIYGLKIIGTTAKRLEICDSEVTMDTFLMTVNMMKHLTHVKFVGLKISSGCGIADPPEFKFLKTLKVIESDVDFKIFQRARDLEDVYIQTDDCKKIDLTSFEQMLMRQNKLRTLELINIRFSNFLEVIHEFPFQLNQLTVQQCHFKVKENFERFLVSQKNLKGLDFLISSLNLKLDRLRYFEDSLTNILKMTNLKTLCLEIKNYQFANEIFLYQATNENVENLALFLETNIEVKTILNVFPNCKKLEMKIRELDQESVNYINDKMHKLEHLKIINLSSESFKMIKKKNLKSLHIQETNIEPGHWICFINNNPQITKLIINFTFFMDLDLTLLSYITRQLKLDHLELIDKYIGMENNIYLMICENCPQLKYLKLWNINVEKDFEEKDFEFLRRKQIKFHLYNDESIYAPIVPF